MSLPEKLSLSVVRKSIPVELESASGIVKCSLREMTGAQRDDFMAAANKKVKFDERGEVVSVIDYTGAYSLLLSYCLYDEDGKLVPEKDIQEWPNTAQNALFEAAQMLNGLKKAKDNEDEDPEKN